MGRPSPSRQEVIAMRATAGSPTVCSGCTPSSLPDRRTTVMKQLSSIVIIGFIAAFTLLLASASVDAAYPKVPKEVQEEANAKLIALRQRSDDIWKQAQPTIEEWAAKGKPYIPWAAKPEDLPQAPIPAFPG